MAGDEESEIVTLARRTIESAVRDGRAVAAPAPLTSADYPPRAGAFVSLHRDGDLRGCIGTIAPTTPTLAEEVAHNAIQAALYDPRFEPLSADELGDLEIKVDVLHEPEECTLDDLDPAKYGVIVTQEWKRGLLLPDLEGVDDVATQVSIAMRKAGIPSDSPCAVERFKVDRYT
jgi:MEMO1 family protein